MIEIRVLGNGKLLELENASIQIEENSDFWGEESQGDFSYPFQIPRTDGNSAVLGGLWAVGAFPPKTRFDCEITIAGNRWKNGVLVIDEVFRNTYNCHILANTATIGQYRNTPIGKLSDWSVQIANTGTPDYQGLLPYLPVGADLCFPTFSERDPSGFPNDYNVFESGSYPAYLASRSGRANDRIVPFANLNFVFRKAMEAIGYQYQDLQLLENVYIGTGKKMPMLQSGNELQFLPIGFSDVIGTITLGHLANCLKPIFGKRIVVARGKAYWVGIDEGKIVDATDRVHDLSLLYTENETVVMGFEASEKAPLPDFEAEKLADFPDPLLFEGKTGLARAEYQYYTAYGQWFPGPYASARPEGAQSIDSCFRVMPMPEEVITRRTGRITDNGSGMARLTMRAAPIKLKIISPENYATASFIYSTPVSGNEVDLPLFFNTEEEVEVDVAWSWPYKMLFDGPQADDKLYIFYYNGVTQGIPWGHVSGFAPDKTIINDPNDGTLGDSFRFYGTHGLISFYLQPWLKLQGLRAEAIPAVQQTTISLSTAINYQSIDQT